MPQPHMCFSEAGSSHSARVSRSGKVLQGGCATFYFYVPGDRHIGHLPSLATEDKAATNICAQALCVSVSLPPSWVHASGELLG